MSKGLLRKKNDFCANTNIVFFLNLTEMELLYVWIEEYRNIKRQGFNFSSEYRFDYTWEGDNWENGKLVGIKNENVFPDFFNVLNQKTTNKNLGTILNITAIVGENGSGKSSLLDFLSGNYNEGNRHKECHNITLFYIGNHGGLIDRNASKYKNTIFGTRKCAFMIWKIDNTLDLDSINKIEKIFNHRKEAANIAKDYNLGTVYYSNIFDTKITKEEFSIRKFTNISSNYLLINDKAKENPLPFLEQIEVYSFKETERRLTFLKNNPNSLPFRLPDEIAFVINNINGIREIDDLIDSKKNFYFDENFINTNYAILLQKIKAKFDYYKSPFAFKKVEDKKNYFLLSTLLNILLNRPLNETSYDKILESNISKLNFDLGNLKTKEIISFCESINFDKEIFKLEEYFDFWLNIIEDELKENKKRFGKDIDVVYLKFNELDSEKLLRKKRNYYRWLRLNTSVNTNFIDYTSIDWTRNLSSGEVAYLNLFSRLYIGIFVKNVESISVTTYPTLSPPTLKELQDEANSLPSKDSPYRNYTDRILLLLDEAETGYHPQWQKEYLSTLINYLPKIFPSRKDKNGTLIQRSIQIILTSHSPFVISDLPKENVVFLRKGKVGETIEGIDVEGKCIVDKGVKHEKTFGANIHTLLSDSFFMDGGLIGDFAKHKIQQLVSRVENYEKNMKNESKEKREREQKEISQLINIIGEPIIRRKLEQVFDDNIKQSVEYKLARAEEEVQRLKEELNKQK